MNPFILYLIAINSFIVSSFALKCNYCNDTASVECDHPLQQKCKPEQKCYTVRLSNTTWEMGCISKDIACDLDKQNITFEYCSACEQDLCNEKGHKADEKLKHKSNSSPGLKCNFCDDTINIDCDAPMEQHCRPEQKCYSAKLANMTWNMGCINIESACDADKRNMSFEYCMVCQRNLCNRRMLEKDSNKKMEKLQNVQVQGDTPEKVDTEKSGTKSEAPSFQCNTCNDKEEKPCTDLQEIACKTKCYSVSDEEDKWILGCMEKDSTCEITKTKLSGISCSECNTNLCNTNADESLGISLREHKLLIFIFVLIGFAF